MEPVIHLVIEGTDPPQVGAVACGKCRRIACGILLPAEDQARLCCTRQTCACGKLTRDHTYAACDDCVRRQQWDEFYAREVVLETKNRAQAREVAAPDYDGEMVFWEGAPDRYAGDCGGGYWSSVAAVVDYCCDRAVSLPPYVWGTTPMVLSLNAADLVADALEEWHDDAFCNVPQEELDALQAYLGAWCARVSPRVRGFETDRGVAVVFPDAWSGAVRVRQAVTQAQATSQAAGVVHDSDKAAPAEDQPASASKTEGST